MLLADLGADVVKVKRPVEMSGEEASLTPDLLDRGKRSIVLDLKTEVGRTIALAMVQQGDVLVEGFRPGVAERLGLGPHDCLSQNPKLIYARMTGWGQSGPLSDTAGHDINYIALIGALGAIGEKDRAPQVPLNMLELGGGAMYLVVGILAALIHAGSSGVGQVVDAAVIDGVAGLLSAMCTLLDTQDWLEKRHSNLLDGGAPFYTTYKTKDSRYIAVGAIEPHFFKQLVDRLEIDISEAQRQNRNKWPEIERRFARIFRSRTLAEWVEVFEGSDACVTPVLTLREAQAHPRVISRGCFVSDEGTLQPGAAPKLSLTPARVGSIQAATGQAQTREVLDSWGIRSAIELNSTPIFGGNS